MKRCFFLMWSSALSAGLLQASMLGPATASGTAYNLLVFGDDTQSSSDVYGPVAIGGSFNGNTTFASQTSASSNSYNIVIGHNLTLSGTQPGSGNIYVGGNVMISNAFIPGNLVGGGSITLTGGTVQGNIQYATTFSKNNAAVNGTTLQGPLPASPLDFASAKTSLENLSNTLTSTSATGIASINQYSHNVTLDVNRNGSNIFNLTAAQVQAMNGFTINDNGYSNVTVIINVAANAYGADTFPNTGYNLNGLDSAHVLFNFSGGTTNLTSLGGVYGSILAPWAALNFSSQLNGQVIVDSLSGNGEIHSSMFVGDLPAYSVNNQISSTATPEPSTVFLVAGGALLLVSRQIRKYLLLRRRKTAAAV